MLVITNDADCSKLEQFGYHSKIVYKGRCNRLYTNITIANDPCLVAIIIYPKALMNINSFTVSNNPLLATIDVRDGLTWNEQYQTNYAPFENTKSFELSSIFKTK